MFYIICSLDSTWLTALVVLPFIGTTFHHKRIDGGHISQVQIIFSFFEVENNSLLLESKMFCEKDFWALTATSEFPFWLWHSSLNCPGNVRNHKGGLVRRGKILSRRNCLLKNTVRERSASLGLQAWEPETSLKSAAGLFQVQLVYLETRDILRCHG